MFDLEKVRAALKNLKDENIIFKKHFYDRIKDRPLTEQMVKAYIKRIDLLEHAEQQPSKNLGEEKYKIWIRLSRKYKLVLIIAISNINLYIITAWNSDRKWKKTK